MNFKVIDAAKVRELPAKGDFPPSAVVHLTLEQNGSQTLATAFQRQDTPLPKPGEVIEGELGDADRFDKDRRKFKRTRPQQGGYRKRDPQESQRIEFQSARRDALSYIELKVRLGKIEDFDLSDVGKITDALRRLDDPPAPAFDIPGDDGGLPPLSEPI